MPGCRKTHVRADPRCRLHGELTRQPLGKARHSVGMTTENYVKYRCRGIRPYDGGTWRALIDEFTENHFTWISRPLIRGEASTSATGPVEAENTGPDRATRPYFDAPLGRYYSYYSEAEVEQVQREIGEANVQKTSAPKNPSAVAVLPHTWTSPAKAHNEPRLGRTLRGPTARGGQRPLGGNP